MHTLDSGIDVSLIFIESCFFPGPTALLIRRKIFLCAISKYQNKQNFNSISQSIQKMKITIL